MKNRKNLMIVTFTIFAVALATVIILKPTAQVLSQQKEQQETVTVVHRGQITEKEREYSKEYRKNYAQLRRKFTFTELINKSISMGKTTEEIGILGYEPEVPGDPDAPRITPIQYLRNISCKADAIVLGSVKNKISHMTDDEISVYTEYPLSITVLLKDNPKMPIQINNLIEVTRPGGVIELDGRRIRVEDRTYPFLQVNRSYILFLRFISSTNGYVISSIEGDFEIENDTFRLLNRYPSPKELREGNNLSALLTDINKVTSTNCSEETK
jgi:hypothetical protein